MNEEEAIAIVNRYKKGKIDPKVAEACYTLTKIYKTCKNAAKKVNKSDSFICHWKKIYMLPEDIKRYIFKGDISPTKASYLSRIKNPEEQRELVWAVIDNNFTEDQIKEAIKDRKENERPIHEVLYDRFGLRDEDLNMIGIDLDSNTYKELRKESARRGLDKAETCQRIIYEWLNMNKMIDLTKMTQQHDQFYMLFSLSKKRGMSAPTRPHEEVPTFLPANLHLPIPKSDP